MRHNIDMARRYIEGRMLKPFRIWLSCLSPSEPEALAALADPVKRAAMIDAILGILGHEVEMEAGDARNKSRRVTATKRD